MKLKEIIDFLDERIPEDLALDFDNVGLMGNYDLNLDIDSIEIFMDLWPEYDDFGEGTLIITHHPPLFSPKTPTYTIHSNWDIIDGGANEALAECLNLEVAGYFDEKTNIGRVCKSDYSFNELRDIILDNFENVRIVNSMDGERTVENIGIISGFGLKNPDYIRLANDKKLDVLISGDLSQETAILAKNSGLTLIDLGHHESEVPGLHKLAELLNELNMKIEVIDKPPIEKLK
jgi:dinuclear metal center YbgI/SA1388 family protein